MPSYKYLGCWIHEFLNFSRTVDALTSAAGRSFGRIVNLFKRMGDMGYETYCTLYDSYILPVANYAAGVWGFENYPAPQVLQNRIIRFYLGVHRYAPLCGIWTEMDWINIQKMRWLDIMRLYNRIVGMSMERLPRKVLEWDCKLGGIGWVNDLVRVCEQINIQEPTNLRYIYDLEPVKRRILLKCREEWKDVTERTSKLSTYCQIKDFTETGLMVKSNLNRSERSLLSRLLCGILPLEVETARYKKKDRVERELRYCKVCNKEEVEDESHLVFDCKELKDSRNIFLKPVLLSSRETKDMSNIDKFKWLLQKEHIKEFSEALTQIYYERQSKMYRKN